MVSTPPKKKNHLFNPDSYTCTLKPNICMQNAPHSCRHYTQRNNENNENNENNKNTENNENNKNTENNQKQVFRCFRCFLCVRCFRCFRCPASMQTKPSCVLCALVSWMFNAGQRMHRCFLCFRWFRCFLCFRCFHWFRCFKCCWSFCCYPCSAPMHTITIVCVMNISVLGVQC